MHKIEASPFVQKFGSRIAAAAGGMPILDVGCGSGRNGIFLYRLGCAVICADKDSTHFKDFFPSGLVFRQLDLIRDPWPFEGSALGGILSVHFFLPSLLQLFANSLSPGGYLLLETIPGCGGNYLDLPKAGEIKRALENVFHLEFYKERGVGPVHYSSVAVKVLAKRTTAIDRAGDS